MPCEVSTLMQHAYKWTDLIFATSVSIYPFESNNIWLVSGLHSEANLRIRKKKKLPAFLRFLKFYDQARKWVSAVAVSNIGPCTHRCCVHIPQQSAIHQKGDEPTHCQRKENSLPKMRDQVIIVPPCQTGATTKPRTNKEVWDYTIIDWLTDDFDHLLTGSPSLPRCGKVSLSLFMWSAVYADLLVPSQLLSE